MEMRVKMERMLREAQEKITDAIAEIDGGATFMEDAWVRESGGGGMSRVLADGKVWEKAGVNLSVVHGKMPQAALAAATERGANRGDDDVPFFACGLSCVMHPRNPHCPTMHFNYRYVKRCHQLRARKSLLLASETDLPSIILAGTLRQREEHGGSVEELTLPPLTSTRRT